MTPNFLSINQAWQIRARAGSWLVGSPSPLFCPWPMLWSLGLVAIGIARCPVWIRLGFFGDND